MLYLSDVLQLVVEGLYDGPLSQQDPVLRAHEHVPHVVATVDDQVQLEAVEPAHGGPALLRKAGESAVGVHALYWETDASCDGTHSRDRSA